MTLLTLTTLRLILLAVMAFGELGLLIPLIPGLSIIWLCTLIYGLITGFSLGSGIIFGIITLIWIAGDLVDNLVVGARVRRSGASWLSLGVAMAAGIAGSLLWPPLGGLVAALAAIFIVEFIRLRDWRLAFRSARSMAAGCGWAVIIRMGIGVMMIFLWVIWTFWV